MAYGRNQRVSFSRFLKYCSIIGSPLLDQPTGDLDSDGAVNYVPNRTQSTEGGVARGHIKRSGTKY